MNKTKKKKKKKKNANAKIGEEHKNVCECLDSHGVMLVEKYSNVIFHAYFVKNCLSWTLWLTFAVCCTL